MNTFIDFFAVIMFVGAFALLYKSWYHRNGKDADGNSLKPTFLNPMNTLGIIIPLKYLPDNETENKKRKLANIALYIFYGSFVFIVIFSGYVKNHIR
jgi:dipeptide/tripeptide permease